MKKIKSTVIIYALLFALLFSGILLVAGCLPATPPLPKAKDKLACSQDSDCVCGGIDTETGTCFLGNKEYFKAHVNQSRVCPDFCGGIAGNLELRCVNASCRQVSKTAPNPALPGSECTASADCAVGGCSGQLCGTREKMQDIMTTCEFRKEYGCYSLTSCSCISGRCQWKETPEFSACLQGTQNGGANPGDSEVIT
ncbi:hypothetical protein COY95_02025 [Candidatus Woesearchaeota archaeon CG_4_10_14_0_8_um_filter_47_5]|nr:MAG: hypothetical protein COY95_02025 [Candidatus Woesearchaeota archaeon CG_4_10_14_0_8_um_filter_47_5]